MHSLDASRYCLGILRLSVPLFLRMSEQRGVRQPDSCNNKIAMGQDKSLRWINITALSENDWRDIEKVAVHMIKLGVMDSDPLRCSIGAFVLWVAGDEQSDAPAL